MNESLLWRWTAKELSLDDFLAQARQEEVTSFELTVHPENGDQDLVMYRLSFCMDAVGYRQEDAVMTREGDFLRAIAFENESCRTAVPLISTFPSRPLFQEIAMQAEWYTAFWPTTLHIALPWREVQAFSFQPGETFEGMYARLEMIEEERRKTQAW